MMQVAIDIASFIWSKEDYDLDNYSYWNMIEHKICLIDKLTEIDSSQLLRSELIDQIWLGFPYSQTPTSTKDYTNRILSYISKKNFIQYSDIIIEGLDSIPNQSKSHYSDNVNDELGYLLSEMYSGFDSRFYLSFDKVWASNLMKLSLKKGNQNKEIQTVVIKSCEDVETMFDDYIPKFEHNPKHTRTKTGDYESSLSCFDGSDLSIPQNLLSTGVLFEGKYYNYDKENNVWVIFRNHLNNLYHGYDENNEHNIPSCVKKKLSR